MIPLFIGFDSREVISWHVLATSIIQQSSEPVSITAVGNKVLPATIWWRPRGDKDSTEFSNARFIVPYLMGYQGWGIFCDSDMVCLADIEELWNQRDEQYAVLLRQHSHTPRNARKFLDQAQTPYRRKNWSSLMLMNCGHPATRELTLEYVNNAPGLDLHGFAWCPDQFIGKIEGPWNELVRHDGVLAASDAKLVHFTDGGPWHGYLRQQYTESWVDWMSALLGGANPSAEIDYRLRSLAIGDNLELQVVYSRR